VFFVKPKVLITRRVPQPGIDLVAAHCDVELWDSDLPIPRATLLAKVADKDALYCLLTERIDDDLLDAAPRLKVVSQMAVGFDNIDVAACTRRGIPVGNTPGVLTETTADFTWALLMTAARRIVEGVEYVRAGHWVTWGPMLLMGPDLYGATLGIVGMGRIGQAVARRAMGFGMRIFYNDSQRIPSAEEEFGATYTSMDQLLAESDFVTLHVNLTPETIPLDRCGRAAPYEIDRDSGQRSARRRGGPRRVGRGAAQRRDRLRRAGCDRAGAAAGRPSVGTHAQLHRRAPHRQRQHRHPHQDGGHGGREFAGRRARPAITQLRQPGSQ
jgi:hypothetical protein